jgi:FAD/FMN-containing dehydrogenase
MIRRQGPQTWKNVHATKKANLADLIDVDNSVATGPQPTGFALLRQAARDIDGLVQQAAQQGKKIRALGSGWALTDIAITDGWLVNTKLLNGCFDVSDRYFEASYPAEKRPYLVLAQCGISIAELNVHLEVTATAGFRRALKTAGIGAGQTVAGSISGNTHGSAINFGATPDYLVGVQVVTGSGKSLWIERASQPVLNDECLAKLEAERVRDDDVFGAAIVSFGSFGVITALAIETDPIYQLKFPPVNDISHAALKNKLNHFDYDDPPGLYHYECIFDPYSTSEVAMETLATKVDYEPGHPAPKPVWLVRNDQGFAPGDTASSTFFGAPLLAPAEKTAFQFKQYRKLCILGDVRATPGQCFTATVSYFEGYTESAIAVPITGAAAMMEISSEVIRQMQLPSMSQVRFVHPSKALLGFTWRAPKSVVFEFGLANDARFLEFEERVTEGLKAAGIGYALHWSKNSLVDPTRLTEMYGADRVARWKEARKRVFKNDAALMKVFENEHLKRAGLA